MRISDRPTSDILVIMVATTICFSVVAGGGMVILIELLNPEADTEQALRTITGIVNTLIGLLAGFLAGKTGAVSAEIREKEPTP